MKYKLRFILKEEISQDKMEQDIGKLLEEMKTFKEDLAKVRQSQETKTKGNTDLDYLEQKFNRFSAKAMSYIENIAVSLSKLENKVDDLEQYGRRNCLLLHGIPERVAKDNPEDIVIKTIKEKLKIDIDKREIDRVHRIGQIKPVRTVAEAVREGTRPIIIKFTNYRSRQIVFSNKRLLKGSGISITESLTKNRMKLVRQAQETYGNRNVWTYDGKIVILNDQHKHTVTTTQQLENIKNTNKNLRPVTRSQRTNTDKKPEDSV